MAGSSPNFYHRYIIIRMHDKIKIPGEVQQNNLPPECGQPIEAGALAATMITHSPTSVQEFSAYFHVE
jgi:hypothetical protein